MSTLLTGSICLTDLIEKAKQKHSAFSKANNGKIYFNFSQWINDEPDNYGNHSSIRLNSKKDQAEAEGKVYIGNAKKYEQKEPEPISSQDAASLPKDDDLPF
jgi:hypothetical protein